MNGIINMMKPPGMSSAQAVSFVKRITGEKIGHAGTLDPEASGVLPLMVGRATKLFDYITDDRKVYLAEIAFGCATDTEDAQGVITEESSYIPSVQEIKSALTALTGMIAQQPPAFSAIKKDGKRLYELARQGIETNVSERPVYIERIDYVKASSKTSHFIRVYCGKGTYIRSLCRDIGRKTGSCAHMRFLLREKVGAFSIADSWTPDEIATSVLNAPSAPCCLSSPDRYLQHLPMIHIPTSYKKQALNGVPIKITTDEYTNEQGENKLIRVYMDHVFLGIAERRNGVLFIKTLYTLNL